jgi:hypothetical protein
VAGVVALVLKQRRKGVSEVRGVKATEEVQVEIEEGVEVHRQSAMPTIGSGGAASPGSGSLGARWLGFRGGLRAGGEGVL